MVLTEEKTDFLEMMIQYLFRVISVAMLGLSLMSCGSQAEDSSLAFSLGPQNLTALNVKTSNCLDYLSSAEPPPTSATAAAIFFDNIKISWVNPSRDLYVYGIRFFAKDPSLTGGRAEVMFTGANLASLFRLKTFCGANCFLERTSTSIPTRSVFIRGGANAKVYLNGETTSTTDGCAPIVGGFTFKSSVTSQVSFPVTVTLYSYSKDDEGNINNEYASANVTLTYQPPPQ